MSQRADLLRSRRGLHVRGAVQGVGFRPAVYRLAARSGLSGFVRNETSGVRIEIEGDHDAVIAFAGLLRDALPPLASIDAIEVEEIPVAGEREFRIVESAAAAASLARIPADVATCQDCLRELRDPADRRYRYPFINCTSCGPRYTIVREVPYDRARTTMERFVLCDACREEYESPASRRFHAEPNACPACGPRLEFAGPMPESGDPLAQAIAALRRGEIVAIKGIGGFHLAVDATSEAAVSRLRQRKHRPHKPFALMARDLDAAREIVHLSERATDLLLGSARPIVVAPRREPSRVAASVAPGLHEIGVMLPYAPLQHLLLDEGSPLLVMTSGNRAEEPIAREDGEALERLRGIADAFLLHDRSIHTRADDSVWRAAGDGAIPIRRSRGCVPEPIRLPFAGPPIVAVGAELKNTICITRGDEAVLSPHVGDLENLESFQYFEEVIAKHARLLGVEPLVVAHDLHPDMFSTRWALRSGLDRVAVQHHHAHLASCLTEHGRSDRAIGVAFDGTGCGPAGELWGGEFFVADLRGFERHGHLRAIALAGGEAAIREPWRLAVAALDDAGIEIEDSPIREILHGGIHAPRATSAGRWFDAVAAIAGVRRKITYEAQAAIELEAIAAEGDAQPYPVAFGGDPFEVDLRPAIREIAKESDPSIVSARFHETMARVILEGACRIRERTGIATVALSGGCFQNARLAERARVLLESAGFEALLHRRVPPNDGGIALGQAAVAAAVKGRV